jgi:hypothetical protein
MPRLSQHLPIRPNIQARRNFAFTYCGFTFGCTKPHGTLWGKLQPNSGIPRTGELRRKGKKMKNPHRTNWALALLAGVIGSVACNSNDTTSARKDDVRHDAGQTGGNGTGGTSAKGGTTGSATGGSSAVGGSAGNASAGGQGTGGGTVGGGIGGSAAGGSGTGAASGGAGGAAGGGGTGRDAATDSANADAPPADLAADRGGGRDTVRSDVDSACPAGQTLCDGTCVNTSSSTSHCGGCGAACAANQVCSGGSCVGTTANDGCGNTLASNLTLKQIAVYQTVKIPIMNNGTEVAATARNAGVVNGRPTLVRVFVTPGSNWTARDLSARLTVVPASGPPAVYTSKKTISVASTDADPKTTFQFNVTADAMVTPLSYSVEVVECGNASGSAGQARFPASGTIDMGVRKTGVLKVKLIPLKYGTLVPDTSDTAMAPYAAQLKAMYPVTDVSFSVGDTLTVTSVDDWSGTLDKVRAKRSADKPAADIYYFGIIKPAADLRTYCKSSCITGVGFVLSAATGSTSASGRAAMGIGFGDKPSTETMAHEIGHNHGRNHAPCSTAGAISGVDSAYPYSKAIIGVWGYDSRTQTLIDPNKYVDLMSYCSPLWLSDYNYTALVTRVAAVSGVANVITVNAEMAKWRVLLLDERGPRWGVPLDEPGPAEGEPEMATIYGNTGEALTSVRVYRTEISDISGAMYMVPEPKASWYAIAVDGAAPLPFAAPMPRL